MDAPEERKHSAENKWLSYHKHIIKAYNKRVSNPIGDLVLKTARHIQKGLSVSKFAPQWKGPYVIMEAFNSGYFLISRPDSKHILAYQCEIADVCNILNFGWILMYGLVVYSIQVCICTTHVYLLDACQVIQFDP